MSNEEEEGSPFYRRLPTIPALENLAQEVVDSLKVYYYQDAK